MNKFKYIAEEFVVEKIAKHPWPNKTKVRTLHDNGRQDWTSLARDDCIWNAIGIIMRHQSGHGLCYYVDHNSKQAWYDAEELELI